MYPNVPCKVEPPVSLAPNGPHAPATAPAGLPRLESIRSRASSASPGCHHLWPTPSEPEYGVFVQTQVEALRRRDGIEIDVRAFPRGGLSYLRAAWKPAAPHGAKGSTSSTRTMG